MFLFVDPNTFNAKKASYPPLNTLVQQIQRQAINKQDQKKQRDASPDNF